MHGDENIWLGSLKRCLAIKHPNLPKMLEISFEESEAIWAAMVVTGMVVTGTSDRRLFLVFCGCSDGFTGRTGLLIPRMLCSVAVLGIILSYVANCASPFQKKNRQQLSACPQPAGLAKAAKGEHLLLQWNASAD